MILRLKAVITGDEIKSYINIFKYIDSKDYVKDNPQFKKFAVIQK